MVGTVTFNEAMLAKDRVFAIRVGSYTSNDIKEASFNYGYISGDSFKPGGTVAGSAKITFTSIITNLQKLDKIYPEIGLQVGNEYEWVSMGEYFVNDISIDRNRNTTELDLIDGMFKLNQPYISDLTYPAQIRDVIREICAKTGVELETDDLGFRAIQHHVQTKADKKDITFREVLSQAAQLLGFSAFFNRKGRLEIRGLKESNITITSDNYFLHGLTKSEIEYQIAGITCKKDKETLTVGLRTGRSLELENSFMIQNILDDLYHDLKNIRYFPYSLDWQGHLKLDVGQWVTLKTNKNETYKVPVLSQSFNFKGGLRSKISADSKAGNDVQYVYKGFFGKRIEQLSTQIEAEVQQQLEYADKKFDNKFNEFQAEIEDGIEQSKAAAEAHADAIKEEIVGQIAEADRQYQAQKLVQDAQIAEILEQSSDAKRLVESTKADLNQTKSALTEELTRQLRAIDGKTDHIKIDVEQTANSLRTRLASLETFKNAEGVRASQYFAASREETARQIAAERIAVANGYVAKSQYTEDVRGLSQRFEEMRVGGANLVKRSKVNESNNRYGFAGRRVHLEAGKKYWFGARARKNGGTPEKQTRVYLYTAGWEDEIWISFPNTYFEEKFVPFIPQRNEEYLINTYWFPNHGDRGGTAEVDWYMVTDGDFKPASWAPHLEEVADTKIAEFQQTVDGRFATLQATKADQVAFQKVQETVNLYQRVLGDGTAVSETIQTAKGLVTRVSNLTDGQNLVYDPTNYSKYRARAGGAQLAVVGTDGFKMIRVTQTGLTANTWGGFQMPLHSQKFVEGEKLSYRVNLWVDVVPDDIIGFEIKSGTAIAGFSARPTKVGNNQIFTGTFIVHRTVTATDDFGLHVWLRKNGSVSIGQISIVRGEVPPTSFVDSTSAMQLAAETQLSTLAGSWAVRNLTSAGTVLNQINVLANGNNRIDGRLTHITGQTLIDNGVITSAKIASMDAGKITSGYISTARFAANSITGDKMVVDQAFFNKFLANQASLKQLFAKDAFIISVQSVKISANQITGGLLRATSGAIEFNLNQAKLAFNASATIEFNSSGNALKRSRNGSTGFIHFNDSAHGGVFVGMGVTSGNIGVKSQDTSSFAGVRVFRDNDTSDQLELYGDNILLSHAFGSSAHSVWISPTKLVSSVDLIEFMRWCRTEILRLHTHKETKTAYSYTEWKSF